MTGGSTMTLVPPYCSPLPSRAWIITEKVSNTHTQTHRRTDTHTLTQTHTQTHTNTHTYTHTTANNKQKH